MTSPISSRPQYLEVNFKPNYYHFDPAHIDAQAKGEKKEHGSSDYIQTIDSEIKRIQYIESIYGATIKHNRYAAGAVVPYLDFLMELNRFEEAASFAEEVLKKVAFEDLEKEVIQNRFIESALHLKAPERVAHLMPEDLPEDASLKKWILLIQFMFERGCHHDLLQKKMPKDPCVKAYLLYLCGENGRVHELSHLHIPENRHFDWILWLIHRRNDSPKADAFLERALRHRPETLLPFIEDAVLEELFSCQIERQKEQIAAYLQKIRENRLYALKFALCLAKYLPQEYCVYMGMIKSFSIAFPNLHNKRILLMATAKKELHEEIWARAVRAANPRLLLLSNVFKYYEQNKKDCDLKNLVEDIDKSGVDYHPLKVKVALSYAYLAKSEDERKMALDKVNCALKTSPTHKDLLLKKLSLLIALNEQTQIETFIDQFWKHFPYHAEFALLASDFFEARGQFEKAYPILKDTYLKTEDEDCLKRLSNRSKGEARLTFFAECVFVKENKSTITYFEEAIKIIKASQDLEKGIGVLLAVEQKENYTFLKLRAEYLIKLEMWLPALSDVEYLYDHNKPCPELKIRVYQELGNLSEACEELITSSIVNAKKLAEELILRMEAEEGENDENYTDEIISLWEKFKPLSFLSTRAVAAKYMDEGEYSKSLAILNELKKQNPNDMELCLLRALSYKFLGQLNTALMVIDEGLEKFKDERLCEVKNEIDIEIFEQKTASPAISKPPIVKTKQPKPSTPKNPVIFVAEKSEKKEKREPVGPKVKNQPVHLQKSAAQAVNPLADPLSAIKAIARKGEQETGFKAPPPRAPSPTRVIQPRTDAPKPIVKIHLTNREKVFLKRALDTLNEVLGMPSVLDQDIIFRNHLYGILRVFTPLRLNSTHPSLVEDLKRIRNNARHNTDQISEERVLALFNYLKSIQLPRQLQDWIKEKSIITRLMLNNHIITVRRQKKSPQEKILSELEFILKKRGEKGTWASRPYDRNAIKASISIIGAESNFLSDELKASFSGYREAGNTIAHEFFEDGDTVSYLERYKEEDISPDDLWELTSDINAILEKVRKNGLHNT